MTFIPTKSGYYRLFYKNLYLYYTDALYFEIKVVVFLCSEFGVCPNPSFDKVSTCSGYEVQNAKVELIDAIGKK